MKMRGVASLVLALAVTLLITGCHLNILPSPSASEEPSNPPGGQEPTGYKVTKEIGSLQLILQTDKEAYSIGEPIPLQFKVINTGSTPIKLTFSTSRTFDLMVKREGTLIWQLSFGKHYLQVITELTLEPGGSRTFNAGWPQVDNAGNQVPIGTYEIIALLPTMAGEPLESAPLMIEVKD